MPPSVASFPVCRRRVSASFNADPSAGDGHASQTMSLPAQPLLRRVSETSQVPDGHHPEMTPRLHRPRTATSPPPQSSAPDRPGVGCAFGGFSPKGCCACSKEATLSWSGSSTEVPMPATSGSPGPWLAVQTLGPRIRNPSGDPAVCLPPGASADSRQVQV